MIRINTDYVYIDIYNLTFLRWHTLRKTLLFMKNNDYKISQRFRHSDFCDLFINI